MIHNFFGKVFKKAVEILDGDNLSYHREALREFYLYSPRTLKLLFVGIFALWATYYRQIPPSILYGWMLALILLTLYRLQGLGQAQKEYIDSYRYFDDDETQTRYRNYYFLAMSTALLISAAPVLFLPFLHETISQYVVILFILGVSAAAAISFYPSRLLMLSYIAVLNFPLIFYFGILLHQTDTKIFALSLIIYDIVIVLLADKTRSIHLELFRKRRNLHVKERELNALFEQTPTPIFYFDTDLKLRKWNRALEKLFDVLPKDLEGFDLTRLHFNPTIDVLSHVIRTQKAYEYEGLYQASFSNRKYWIRANVVPLYDDDRHLIGGIVNIQDKTVEKTMMENLENFAIYDTLTGLSNRRKLMEDLQTLIDREASGEEISLLFFIDLNRFKPINDTMGHHYGDLVLKKVASALEKFSDEETEVYRYGGDEFVLLDRFCCKTSHQARDRARQLAIKINHALQSSVHVEDHHFPMSASVGIVIITPQMKDIDEIIRRSDVAMYQSKKNQTPYEFYKSSFDDQQKKSFYLQQDLRKPELTRQLRLYYQPIHRISDSKLVSAEVLIRWQHPRRGLLSPDEFIPLAIDSGEIDRLGAWVRQEVCKDLHELGNANFATEKFPLEYVSLNVDAHELRNRNFVSETVGLLENYSIPADRLVFELTENSFIENFENFQKVASKLKKIGIRWSIDDFGMGYSSLSYLERLSLSFLKIDRNFTKKLCEEAEEGSTLVESIIHIAHHFDYRVIAEGIETLEQIEKLRKIDPDLYCQGYYYHRPMPKDEFLKLLKKELA